MEARTKPRGPIPAAEFLCFPVAPVNSLLFFWGGKGSRLKPNQPQRKDADVPFSPWALG